MKRSFWEKEVWPSQPDVVIIGAGIVGLNAAISLKELKPELQVAILDQSPFPAGASTRNAGFACMGSPTELLDDLKSQSISQVFDLVDRRWQGLQKLRERVGEHEMDYHGSGGYEIFKTADQEAYKDCLVALPSFNAEMRRISGQDQAFVIENEAISAQGLSKVAYMIGLPLEGQLHPGKMIRRLTEMAAALGVSFVRGAEVAAISHTGAGFELVIRHAAPLKAAGVIVAVNGFGRKLIPTLPLEPARNQVLITNSLPDLQLKGVFHYQAGYGYFRNVGKRVLIGGWRHLAREEETTLAYGDNKIIQDQLEQFLGHTILASQQWEISDSWSGILGTGIAKQPVLEEWAPGCVLALRLGGMGVALGTELGDAAARLLNETL